MNDGPGAATCRRSSAGKNSPEATDQTRARFTPEEERTEEPSPSEAEKGLCA